jgi:hypothetical protein
MQRWRRGPTHGIANPENRGFKSLSLLQVYSLIAQLVEYVTVNHGVAGSSPAQGANFMRG